MANIHEKIDEELTKIEQEIKHLNQVYEELKKEEKNMPRQSYQREESDIKKHIANQENKKNTFSRLKEMLTTEKDPQIRHEILEELAQITNYENQAFITDELRKEIDTYLEQDEKQKEESKENDQDEYKEQLDKINEQLSKNRQLLKDAQDNMQRALDSMLEVYNAEQQRFNEGEWVRNAEGVYEVDAFDKFVEEYLSKMRASDKDYQAAKDLVTRTQSEIRRLENERRKIRRLQQAEAEKTIRIEKAIELNMTIEEYSRIVEAVSKKSVYRAVLEKQGLGEILHKRGGRSKQERQMVESAKEEIITRLVEEQRKSTTQINIKETIDILYGTELSVKKEKESRALAVSEEDIKNISKKANTGPKKLTQNPNYTPNYIPGPAPTDVPRLTAGEPILALPPAQKVLALPPARTLTAKDYQMTQEAFDDYIAQGFVPGEEDFNTAVTIDGTGVIPRKYIAPEQEKKVTPSKKKTLTAKDYQMTQEAFDDYIAQGFVPGEEDFDTAVIIDGTGIVPRKQIVSEQPAKQDVVKKEPLPKQPIKGGTFTTPDGGMISIDVAYTPTTPTKTPVVIPKPTPTTVTPKPTPTNTQTPVVTPKPTPTTITPTKTPAVTPVVIPKPTPTTVTPKPTPTNTQTPVVTPKPTPTTITPTKTPVVTPTPKKQSTNLYRVIQKITKGVEVKAKDGKAYKASNIKVAQNFRNELKSGNYLYNIVHLVPAIVKVPIQFLMKISGKLRFGKKSKQRIETMKRNIENLTEEEIMILYKEYKGNRVIQENFPSIINVLIEEKIQKFILGKVTTLNQQLENDYNYIFSTLQQIEATDQQLRNPKLSATDKNKLLTSRKTLVAGAAQVVARIRTNYNEAQDLLSGGLQGFSQDMKAAATKLSVVGMRFAKQHDLDHDLLEQQAKLKDAENKAIEDGNDEMALRVFVESEKLLSEQTSINNSIFGRRSTGKKYYSPLAEKLDYRDDPFIRDLFTTAALASAAFNVVNTLKGNDLSRAQAEIDAANQQLGEAQKLVDTIKSHQGTMKEGMEAQAIQGTTSITGQIERGALDSTNWGLGTTAYRTADNAGHAFYNQVFNDTQTQIGNITSQYASNAITQAQALEMMRDLANGTQSTLNTVSGQCLQVFTDYAKTHPQFDLTAVTEAVQYITQHPNAISNMNNAVVDISNMAEGLTFTQIQALQTVPTDMLTPLIGVASVAALTSNLSQTMEENVKKGKYGNSVTKMVEEYAQDHPSNQQNNQRSI